MARKQKTNRSEEPKQYGWIQYIPLITAIVYFIVELLKKL